MVPFSILSITSVLVPKHATIFMDRHKIDIKFEIFKKGKSSWHITMTVS